jgi:hypothetical protein
MLVKILSANIAIKMFIKELCGVGVDWNGFLDALYIHTKLHMQQVAFFLTQKLTQ